MADNRIKTRYGVGPSLWKTGDEITSERSLQLQPHVTITQSKHLVNMGCFSYTFSSLDRAHKDRPLLFGLVERACHGAAAPDVFSSPPGEMLYKRGTHNQSIKDMNPAWRHHPFDETGGGPPVVGNDVWIGQDVLIGPKARLGDGCVVAAGSIVTKDVPALRHRRRHARPGDTIPLRPCPGRRPPGLAMVGIRSPFAGPPPLGRPPRLCRRARGHEREMGPACPVSTRSGLAYDVVASLA